MEIHHHQKTVCVRRGGFLRQVPAMKRCVPLILIRHRGMPPSVCQVCHRWLVCFLGYFWCSCTHCPNHWLWLENHNRIKSKRKSGTGRQSLVSVAYFKKLSRQGHNRTPFHPKCVTAASAGGGRVLNANSLHRTGGPMARSCFPRASFTPQNVCSCFGCVCVFTRLEKRATETLWEKSF